MADPDGLDIGPSLAAVSSTLSLGPGMMNFNTPSGSTTFFPQGDAANPLVIEIRLRPPHH
jgi:hypothetical protein